MDHTVMTIHRTVRYRLPHDRAYSGRRESSACRSPESFRRPGDVTATAATGPPGEGVLDSAPTDHGTTAAALVTDVQLVAASHEFTSPVCIGDDGPSGDAGHTRATRG